MAYLSTMRFTAEGRPGNGFAILASLAIVVAVLYFARDVFVPIALAWLLCFLLAPLVVRLGRCGLGKIPSIVLAVSLTFTLIGVIGWMVVVQVVHLADQLPHYQQNLHAKVLKLRNPQRGGVLAKATTMVQNLRKELQSLTQDESQARNNLSSPTPPIPVEVINSRTSPVTWFSSVIGPALKPLALSVAVVFLVILMLFQREDLRERFLKLISGGELNVATQAVTDAARRVSRYLLMQLMVNTCYGSLVGTGLYFIGVPNAFLWGLLAALLRFIPFVGIWIAAGFPLALAFAIDPGWTKFLLAAGLYLVVEVLTVNLAEPWFYGSSTGVSKIALLIAAVFWAWLWGPVGLLLSTPLTVGLLVLGKYVPGLAFLDVLLGSEPVLGPEVRFYQRMLAMDEDELLRLSEQFIQERSLAELYDTVLIPALSLAEQERHKGALSEIRQNFIVQKTRELIEILGEITPLPDNLPPALSSTATTGSIPSVFCLPAKDEADELAALMLQQLLERRGIAAEALSVRTFPADWSKSIRSRRVQVVCISGIPPFAVAPARALCKRLKQQLPALKVLIGIWSSQAQPTEISNRLGACRQDALVLRLSEAVLRLEALLNDAASGSTDSTRALPETHSAPLSSPHGPEPVEIFDATSRLVAKILNVPVSLVSLIQSDEEFWRAHGGLPPGLASGDGLRETPLYEAGVATQTVFAVPDLDQDDRFAKDPLLRQRGIRFFTGVPLLTSDGHRVGLLCVTDTRPHDISESDTARLQTLAEKLIAEIEGRKLQPA